MNETTEPNYSQKDATTLLVTKKSYLLASEEISVINSSPPPWPFSLLPLEVCEVFQPSLKFL